MSKKVLGNLPLNAFDDDGWLKPPLLIYANLAFLAKGLILFIMSLASRSQSDAILAIFFPQKSSLYIALIFSLIPIFTLISLTIGKLHDQLTLKRGLFFICAIQVIAEISFLLHVILAEFHPFASTTFKVLLSYVFLLAFSISSVHVRLFIKQLFKGQGLIENKDDPSLNSNDMSI